jgi:TonB family protein
MILPLLPELPANPATLEACSQDHAMHLDVIPAGADVACSVRITDLRTGEQLLASPKIALHGTRPETYGGDFRDRKLHVVLCLLPDGLLASVNIFRDGTVVDSMEARWALGPKPRALHPPGFGSLRASGDVRAPEIVHKVEPHYPDEAREKGIAGNVIVEVVIDKSGIVRDVKVLKPLPFGLDQAAVDVVRQWRFAPATVNGEPLDVIFQMIIGFPRPAGQ